jgi:hypothetical protein
MMYPLVTDLADEGIPVVLTCRVLGFSKQAYYAWQHPRSERCRASRRCAPVDRLDPDTRV